MAPLTSPPPGASRTLVGKPCAETRSEACVLGTSRHLEYICAHKRRQRPVTDPRDMDPPCPGTAP